MNRPDEAKQSYARAWGMEPSPAVVVTSPPPPVTELEPVNPVSVQPPTPASFVAPLTPQLLDMVILVDGQAPTKNDLTEMDIAITDAMATTARPTDVRVTWLGIHRDFDAPPFNKVSLRI